MFRVQVKKELQSDKPLIVEFVVNLVIIIALVLLYRTNVCIDSTHFQIIVLLFHSNLEPCRSCRRGHGHGSLNCLASQLAATQAAKQARAATSAPGLLIRINHVIALYMSVT